MYRISGLHHFSLGQGSAITNRHLSEKIKEYPYRLLASRGFDKCEYKTQVFISTEARIEQASQHANTFSATMKVISISTWY